MNTPSEEVSAEQYERLKPPEKRLIDRDPGTQWTHPLRVHRMGDTYDPQNPGYMIRYRCRFCVTLDGAAPTDDTARIGFGSEAQFIGHLRFHERD